MHLQWLYWTKKSKECVSGKAEAHSEPCQAFRMELLAEIVNDLKPLTIFAKRSILYVWQGSEYVSKDDVSSENEVYCIWTWCHSVFVENAFYKFIFKRHDLHGFQKHMYITVDLKYTEKCYQKCFFIFRM